MVRRLQMSIEKEAVKAFHNLPLQDRENLCTTLQAFTLGYKTATEELEARKFAMVMSEKVEKQLREQIEKMKCGGNCKHEYWINTGGCYDQKCRFTGLDCTNCKDKWEIKEND